MRIAKNKDRKDVDLSGQNKLFINKLIHILKSNMSKKQEIT